MKIHCVLSVLLLSFATIAGEPISVRVDHAKAVENSAIGQAYQKELWRSIGQDMANLMRGCFPQEAKMDAKSFTFVADVRASGTLGRVRIEPSTPMTRCFSAGFAKFAFPKPPSDYEKTGMPIVIQMKITE